MKRDFVCCLRLLVDSMPSVLRNSRLLFEISRVCFGMPPSLFLFRAKYKAGLISDLSKFYEQSSPNTLDRISSTTDINSMHMRILKNCIARINPLSFLDAGCGSGYLLNTLALSLSKPYFIGIDYQAPTSCKSSRIEYRTGDLLHELQKLPDHSVEFVICAHVVEHLSYPAEVVGHLRRISSKCLVIICPLEKEFKWGMNYHVNFFPDKKSFTSFLSSAFKSNQNPPLAGVMHERLGDIMYVESKASPPDKSTTGCY